MCVRGEDGGDVRGEWCKEEEMVEEMLEESGVRKRRWWKRC